jgi:hypothetical protein
MPDDKVETNVFWAATPARELLESFHAEAKAMGYDFLLIISDPKTKVYRTLYECEHDHVVMTNAIDQSYDRILSWYESQGGAKK